MEGLENFSVWVGPFLAFTSFTALLIAAYKMAMAPMEALRDLSENADVQDAEIAEVKEILVALKPTIYAIQDGTKRLVDMHEHPEKTGFGSAKGEEILDKIRIELITLNARNPK